MFLVEYRREIRCPREGVFVAARDESYFRPVTFLFRKKAAKIRRKDGGGGGGGGGGNEHRKLYVTADVHASLHVLVFNEHGLRVT